MKRAQRELRRGGKDGAALQASATGTRQLGCTRLARAFNMQNTDQIVDDAAPADEQGQLVPAGHDVTIPYRAPDLPTKEDLQVAEAKKLVLRVLDTRISQQDPPTALCAIQLALKLVSNILDNPGEEKYQRFKSSNPKIQKQLLRVPGGDELLLHMGFKTKVQEFEEFWVACVSPIWLRVLGEARAGLARYETLVASKVEEQQKQTKQRLEGTNKVRQETLAQIEADKLDRRDRSWR
eukprot:1394583-Pleurochrysis_carterae.AAC.4